MMDGLWILFELAINLFEVFISVETVTKYLGSKYDRRRTILFGSVAVIVLFLELSYVNYLVSFEGIVVMLQCLIIFLYAMIALKGTWEKKLYCSILIMLIIIGVTALVMNLTGILSGQTYLELIENQNRIRLVTVMIIQVLIFYTTRILLHKKQKGAGEVTRGIWLLTIGMPVISVAVLTAVMEIVLHTTDDFQNIGSGLAVVVSVGVFCINILIYTMYMKLKRDTAEQIEYEVLKEGYRIRKKDMEDVKKLYMDLRKMKHDMRHHINLLHTLLEKEAYEEVRQYLKEYEDADSGLKKERIFSDNTILNYIVNAKLQVMEQEDIRFVCDICERIEGITDIDLNIILGNLFDNAIEACRKMMDSQQEIELSIYRKAGYLVIRMENTYGIVSEEMYRFKTTKRNKKEHGFGLLSVKETAEKYNGTLEIKNDENRVSIKVVLESDAE